MCEVDNTEHGRRAKSEAAERHARYAETEQFSDLCPYLQSRRPPFAPSKRSTTKPRAQGLSNASGYGPPYPPRPMSIDNSVARRSHLARCSSNQRLASSNSLR